MNCIFQKNIKIYRAMRQNRTMCNKNECHRTIYNKGYRKRKGQSRMVIPQTLATLGTQDTSRRRPKHNTRTLKDEQYLPH